MPVSLQLQSPSEWVENEAVETEVELRFLYTVLIETLPLGLVTAKKLTSAILRVKKMSDSQAYE